MHHFKSNRGILYKVLVSGIKKERSVPSITTESAKNNTPGCWMKISTK